MPATVDRLRRLIQTPASADTRWRLTRDHALIVRVREGEEARHRTLSLTGTLLDAAANSLGFAVEQVDNERLERTKRLTLRGRWRADANNRLNFLVEKTDGSHDRLTLQGGWEIGKHQELVYRYRQFEERGRPPNERSLIFDGAWDITRHDRLVYRLAGATTSAFEFRAALQSPSLLARDGRLVYQVGIGVAGGGRARRQRVTLFGAWKLHRDLSVSFEVPYAEGRVGTMRFEGALTPILRLPRLWRGRSGSSRASAASRGTTRRDTLAVALAARQGGPLGVTVTFTKDAVRDASLFLQWRKEAEEQALLGGVRVSF